MLAKLTCLSCGHVGMEAAQSHGHPTCPNCNTLFDSDQVVCPQCDTLNPISQQHCMRCNTLLARTCRQCGSQNWAGASECANCGRPLDVVDQIIERQAYGFKGTLESHRSQVATIRAEEEASSQRRMASLREQEERYRRRIAEAKARRDAEQQKVAKAILLVAAGLVGLLVVGAVLLVLLSN